MDEFMKTLHREDTHFLYQFYVYVLSPYLDINVLRRNNFFLLLQCPLVIISSVEHTVDAQQIFLHEI